jgi:alpha-L-rhamnosidase
MNKIISFGFVMLFGLSMQAQIVVNEFIYDNAPFPECHASTITTWKGSLLAAWFGGTHEKHQDVGIWLARKSNGFWSEPVEVADGIQHADKRYPCWNPVLFTAPDATVYLYYKVGPNPREWWGELKKSMDGGATWSDAMRLPEDILGPVKNKPVLIEGKGLLCPSSTEHDGWTIHMEWTRDHGKTWRRIGPLKASGDIQAIQPTLLDHGNGKLQLLCRSKVNGVVESWSMDQGETWSELAPTSLPNPNSGIDGVTTRSGEHFLVYNPTSTPAGKWGGDRWPLVLARSTDGENWETMEVLESEPGEYSYPAIIEGADGRLHITYTWKRDKVKHLVYIP